MEVGLVVALAARTGLGGGRLLSAGERKKEKRENIVEFFSYVSPFFTEPQRVKRRRRNNSHHHHHHHHGNKRKRKKKTEGRRGSRSITKLAAAAAAAAMGKWMERTAGRQMALIRNEMEAKTNVLKVLGTPTYLWKCPGKVIETLESEMIETTSDATRVSFQSVARFVCTMMCLVGSTDVYNVVSFLHSLMLSIKRLEGEK